MKRNLRRAVSSGGEAAATRRMRTMIAKRTKSLFMAPPQFKTRPAPLSLPPLSGERRICPEPCTKHVLPAQEHLLSYCRIMVLSDIGKLVLTASHRASYN